MRLRDWERAAIADTARDVFGQDARVRLFGSRLDDSRLGGDIDLYVEKPCSPDDHQRRLFARLLQRRVGERSIDIVYAAPAYDKGSIDQVARAEGVLL